MDKRFGLKTHCIADIVDVLKLQPEIQEAIIFGSRAMGTYKNGSDIDIALKGEKITFDIISSIRLRLDKLPYLYMYDIIDYKKISSPAVVAHIDELGIAFYKKQEMPSDWKTYKLNELVEIKYGKDHKHLKDGNIPVYGSGGIMRYVDTPLYEKESILIPRKGTLSNLFYLNKPFWSVDTMFYTKIKEGNNGKYLYYLLKSMDLASMNVGSAVPSLTTEVLNKLEIQIPPLSIQTQIAEILSSLDDKIELNLQMNQTLEAMAQALFKEWCWVEEGIIPEGWTWKKLLDIADVSSSKRIFRDEYILKGVPFYRGKEVTQLSNGEAISTELFISDERYSEIKEKFGVPQIGDILITSVGTIGSIWLVDNDAPFYFKDGNVTWIKDYKTAINGEFVYQWLQTKEAKEQIKSVTIGSTQQALTISALRGLNILIPDTETVSNVCIQLEKINAKRINNLNQIQTLTQTRDTLLPKLMSGKIALV